MGKKKGQGGEKTAIGWSAALLRIMVGGVIGAAVCGIVSAAALRLSGKRLRTRLEEEFGKRRH